MDARELVSGARGDAAQPAGGGGFGLDAAPVGAYVIRDGDVRWEPTVDVNRIALGGMLLGIAALLSIRSIVRTMGRRRSPVSG